MQVWAPNASDKLVIFCIFGPILLKNAKTANLHIPVWAQIPSNLDEIIYEYDRIFKDFHAFFGTRSIDKVGFFRKSLSFLLEDNEAGKIWIKMFLNSGNSSTLLPTIYLKWFGPEISPNDCVQNISSPLYDHYGNTESQT